MGRCRPTGGVRGAKPLGREGRRGALVNVLVRKSRSTRASRQRARSRVAGQRERGRQTRSAFADSKSGTAPTAPFSLLHAIKVRVRYP